MGNLKNLSAALLPHAAMGAALSVKSYFRGRAMLPAYLKQIQDHFPDFSFRNARLIDSSFANVVVVLDDDWIFRFPRREWRRAAFSRELRLLRRLRQCTAVKVPEYVYVAPDQSFGGYKMLKGVELGPGLFQSQDRSIQESVAEQFADLLGALHGLTSELAGGGRTWRNQPNWRYSSSYFREQRKYLIHKLDPTLLARLDSFYEGFARAEVGPEQLIHGDLDYHHVLLEPETGTLGVIDFGDARLGDPAQDLALLYAYPEWVTPYALGRYRRPQDPGLTRRALLHSVRFAFERLWDCLRHEGHPRPFPDTVHALSGQLALLDA